MQIIIGAVTFTVCEVAELASRAGELYGDINYERCRIRIRAESHPQVKRITLWHEILHGVLDQAGIANHDEQVIDVLAHGIVQVLRDNPMLRGTDATRKL